MHFPFVAFLPVVILVTLVTAGPYADLRGRTTTDTCGCVSSELVVTSSKTHRPTSVGLISTCFCTSDIADVMATQPAALVGKTIAGAAAVKSALTNMLNKAPGHKSCTFPDHSEHACSHSNPCGFTCKDGFIPSPPFFPTHCVCEAPLRVCNGVCGFFPGHLCPSAKPWKRDLESRLSAMAVCEQGEMACGVYGWQGSANTEAWECVDTTSDLESCGGCTVPFDRTPAHGIDCTAIPGVMDVACAAGSCVVKRCMPGYFVSMDRAFCVRNIALITEGDIPAAEYGLGHVPLKQESD